MPRQQDHYGSLKLHKNATKQQIKAKFYEVSTSSSFRPHPSIQIPALSTARHRMRACVTGAAANPQLSKKTHPDTPGGSAEKFHEINEAYSVLGDEAKRWVTVSLLCT